MKLLMLGEVRNNCGSIDAFRGYANAARRLGLPLTVTDVRRMTVERLTTLSTKVDYVLCVVEHSLSGHYRCLVESVPFAKRILIDVDINCTLGEAPLKTFLSSGFALILQPITAAGSAGVISYPFYGYEPSREMVRRVGKSYDLLYVGNNWFRWNEISSIVNECLVHRPFLHPRIGLCGKWWAGSRPSKIAYAIKTDQDFIRSNGITIMPAVPHSQVIPQMSLGRINAVLQRDIFRKALVVTPRLFETLAADTLPLFCAPEESLCVLYGSMAKALLPHRRGGFGRRFRDMLRRPDHYRNIRDQLRHVARMSHSYDRRVTDLANLLRHR